MSKRTTIEIDEALLRRARQALGEKTTRGTVEEALRRAADAAEDAHAQHVSRQRRYLEQLNSRVDVTVLQSEEMWR
jgi:Arc/MetJ family transcription regulator